PWPGRHPLPAPALVHCAPLPAEVVGSDGAPVAVSGRGRLSASPAKLSIGGRPWLPVSDWAGPWTADERWWDRPARRRRARLQLLVEGQQAHLCLVEAARWWIEATYA
ncbi:MAG: DNA polymerase Y family protein, partial [Acidimicrobiales bacterium]